MAAEHTRIKRIEYLGTDRWGSIPLQTTSQIRPGTWLITGR